MPYDEPVVVRRLVEERRAERYGGRAKRSTRENNQARIAGDLLDDRMAHQMPCASTAPRKSRLFERSAAIRNVVLIQDARYNIEAIGDVI